MKCRVLVRKLDDDARLPEYAHEHDAGADLYSAVELTVEPFERAAVPTGLAIEVPPGFEAQVRAKSGLALSAGLAVVNAPGTIDAGYRGEVKVLLVNLGREPYMIAKGQKIAQLVLAPVVRGEFVATGHLSDTARGEGGFGSTGVR